MAHPVKKPTEQNEQARTSRPSIDWRRSSALSAIVADARRTPAGYVSLWNIPGGAE